MVILEPPWEWNGMTSETLFQDIISGKYDSTLELIFKTAQQEAPKKFLLDGVMRWRKSVNIPGQRRLERIYSSLPI